MTTTTTDLTAPRSHARQLVRAGGIAAATSAALAVALAAVALALDVPLQVVMAGGSTPEQIPVAMFGVAALLAVGVGTALAVGLDRWVRRPSQVFTVTALVATLLSFVPVLGAEGATDATKVVLALAHLVVAAVTIPVIAAALARAGAK